MGNLNKIPGINDAATKDELKKLFKDLMAQKNDMDHSNNPTNKPTRKKKTSDIAV
ncbi:hypothetical protein SAMN05660742_10684 [Propionispira arboris]|uniref:Uncharacterized protein n=1 Tax=Propionispira arboris TaxID=84035 RepID=A0A1H6Y8V3_9FIRM|nr:hypothetical protein [Propionispira arboris]SEJ35467.1 hypothetical protein SAMN05660742_10684 [Propionispira arboris]